MTKPLRVILAAAALALVSLVLPSETIRLDEISITTDGSGDGSGSITSTVNYSSGRVVFVWYKGNTVAGEGFAATADFTITCSETAEGIWTESNIAATGKMVAPTKVVQDQTGTDRVQYDYVWCLGSISFVVAQGGASNTGTFQVLRF